MVKANYVPDRGDIVWLNFEPQAGREQSGHRPALILSPQSYNKSTGLAIACPITSQVKGYPFEVTVRASKSKGVILSDHVKSIDWRQREAKFVEKSHVDVLGEVLGKLTALLF